MAVGGVERSGSTPRVEGISDSESGNEPAQQPGDRISSAGGGQSDKIAYKAPPDSPELTNPNEPTSISELNSLIDPEILAQAIKDYAEVLDNMEKTLEDAIVFSGNDLDDIDRNFLRTITNAIRGLKEALLEIQTNDSQQARLVAAAKAGELLALQAATEERTRQRAEQAAQEEKSRKMQNIFNILGPILTVVAAIATVASAGACAPLLVAALVVTAVVVAYSQLDQKYGLTKKIMEAMSELIDKMLPDLPPNATEQQKNEAANKKAALKAVFAAVAVAIFVAVAAASGGAGSGALAQVAFQIINQLAVQAAIMSVMSSNALPELISAICKSCGVDEKDCKIVEMVVMAFEMLAILYVMSKGGKLSPKEFLKDVKEGVQQVTTQISNSVKQFANAVSNIGETARSAAESMKQFGESLIIFMKSISATNVGNFVAKELQEFANFAKNNGFKLLLKLGEISPMAANVVNQAMQVQVMLKVAKILEELGDVQSARTIIESMIKLLEKLLSDIQSDIQSEANIISDMQRSMKGFLDTFARSSALMAQSA